MQEFPTKRRRSNKTTRPKKRNNIVVTTINNTVPVNRIYRRVRINGSIVRTRLDTGADVTLPSLRDCSNIGRPHLSPSSVKLKTANNKDIKIFGQFKCDFDVDGRQGNGIRYAADTTSLLGLNWISQDEQLFQRLSKSNICSVSTATVEKRRSTLNSTLQQRFPAAFSPGLEHCTKAMANSNRMPNLSSERHDLLGILS